MDFFTFIILFFVSFLSTLMGLLTIPCILPNMSYYYHYNMIQQNKIKSYK